MTSGQPGFSDDALRIAIADDYLKAEPPAGWATRDGYLYIHGDYCDPLENRNAMRAVIAAAVASHGHAFYSKFNVVLIGIIKFDDHPKDSEHAFFLAVQASARQLAVAYLGARNILQDASQ